MSYEKHTWVNNETITAAKMNNIEDGIEEAAQSGGGGGYDGEVILYHSNSSSDDWETTIVSGSFASLATIINNDSLPNVLFRVRNDLNGEKIIAIGTIYAWDISASTPVITFHAIQPYDVNSNHQTVSNCLMYISWHADDTITV